jgi:hypothetical protein
MSTLQPLQSPLTATLAPNRGLLSEDRLIMTHYPMLLDSGWCDEVARRLGALQLEPYQATVGSSAFAPIPKLGPALFEYHDDMHMAPMRGLEAYFQQAQSDSQLLRGVFRSAGIPDPLDVIHDIAEKLLGSPVEVAREGDRPYFSGVVRDISMGALPHYDDASVDTPQLAVGRTERQLSILLYLSDFEGGVLTSYDLRPTGLEDASLQLGYGYSWESVRNVSRRSIAPSKGSVIAFNPRYIHSVSDVTGGQRRLTVSSFVGRARGGKQLISWS